MEIEIDLPLQSEQEEIAFELMVHIAENVFFKEDELATKANFVTGVGMFLAFFAEASGERETLRTALNKARKAMAKGKSSLQERRKDQTVH